MWETLRSGQDFDVRIPVYMSDGECIDDYHIDYPKNASKLQEFCQDSEVTIANTRGSGTTAWRALVQDNVR